MRARLSAAVGGAALLPLVLLFFLNLVDELDQVAFGVVAPEIADTFGLSDSTMITIATIAGALVITLIVPVGVLADRHNRVRMSAIAATLWMTMGLTTGVAGFLGFLPLLAVARFGSGLGRVMNEPVHASLLADYYAPQHHGRVFSFHRMANPIGLLMVLGAGALADSIGWRAMFLLLALPTVPAIFLISRLTEPARGASVDRSLADRAEQQQPRVPVGEAYRRLSAIPSLKRSWIAAFFLGAGVIPITSFFSFFYENVYNLGPGPWGRAGVVALFGLGTLLGLQVGGHLATAALTAGRLDLLAVRGGLTLVGAGLALMAMSMAPWVGLSIAFAFVVGLFSSFQSFNLPLVAAVAPPRLRSQAFAWFGLWFAAGAIFLAPTVARIGDDQGYRTGVGSLAVLVITSGLIYMTSHRFVRRDAEQAFHTLQLAAGIGELRDGDADQTLLVCRGIEVAYDQVQVLFGVDMDVHPGEIVALLGTNGAGKSTMLKAISGLVDPIGGIAYFEGGDITHTDAAGTAHLGIVQMPGGKAVFPTLTVDEHLRVACWLYRDEPDYVASAVADVFETFPRLAERRDQMAGNLSGGEQQMLALGMAFVAKPKLLMIDELSLGLAPTIVEQLLDIVRRIRDQGTAIILVEQSINVALSVAERAYFLEKGQVRFEGRTADLLERDDIVRSVFLSSAAQSNGHERAVPATKTPVLTLSGVSKSFGGIRAVDDVDLVLHDGEIVGLIGANGAGKTTIFDLISGFLTPDAGRIELLGDDVTQLSPDRRAWLGLGRSFQDARLVPSLTVAENLAIGLERHLDVRDHVAAALGLPMLVQQEDDVAYTVEDLVELMHLGAFRDKFVRELSTGSRRIVDLAMCIAHDPRVLLLDEPAAGIAQAETEALGPVLQRIQAETGCALLLIEHDMPLITGVSDRLIALELGHPIAEGTPDEVIADPRVVSSYLGGDMATIERSGRRRRRRVKR